jgi:hypothetical protein
VAQSRMQNSISRGLREHAEISGKSPRSTTSTPGFYRAGVASVRAVVSDDSFGAAAELTTPRLNFSRVPLGKLW